jgi:type VI secretion system protein ImpH
MGKKTGYAAPDLNDILGGGARQASFYSAVDAAHMRLCHAPEEKILDDHHVDGLWFFSNPGLAFPGTEIERITLNEEYARATIDIVVNFMGLHGAGSPLPDYLTEAAHWSATEDGATHEFNDFFNGRLYELLFLILRKYRYERRYQQGGEDLFSDWMFAFFGMATRSLRGTRALPWSKLLSLMGLLASQSRSADMLAATIAHCFDFEHVIISDFVFRQVRIVDDQRMRLGRVNATLGHDTSIGAEVPSANTKIVVVFSHLTFAQYDSLLPNGNRFGKVIDLLDLLLKDPVAIDFDLGMAQDEVPVLHLGDEGSARIGWSSFLGGAAGQDTRRARVKARA